MRLSLAAAAALACAASPAQAIYWNVFNIEGENSLTASIVTYATLTDMAGDTNRLGILDPNATGFGRNVVDSDTDGQTYWNLFNIEGESSLTASFVTYATVADMLADTNRLGIFDPNATGFGRNVVGSGSDGQSYWNVFNVEGESGLTASIVTYATLPDMLTDTNRLGVFDPNASGFGRNVVGSGSDGMNYWNVFNIEGENSLTASIVTYATLSDMLTDTNRVGLSDPNATGFGRNVVGGGASLATQAAMPAPPGLALLATAMGALAVLRLRRLPA